MATRTILILAVGTCAMLIPALITAKQYGIALYKSVAATVLLTIAGVYSVLGWFYLENGYYDGMSFYGAVFLVPPVFLFLPYILKISYGELMDICAPAECAMLFVMKCKCMIDGCCGGRILYFAADGTAVLFPSQMLEALNAIMIMAALLVLVKKGKRRGNLYPQYMVMYGSTRFALNLFRERQATWFLGMSVGNIWSILSVIIGMIWLYVFNKRETNRNAE